MKVARQNPDKQVVFLAIVFETTAQSTALTVLHADQEGVRNFTIFCNHVIIIPAIKAILDAPDLRLDGFIGPGHVSTVIGCRPYEFITRDFGKPVVIAGFEPLDILQAIYMLLKQLAEGRCAVENQYTRVVPWNGNGKAWDYAPGCLLIQEAGGRVENIGTPGYDYRNLQIVASNPIIFDELMDFVLAETKHISHQ